MSDTRWIAPFFGVLALVIGVVVAGCGGGEESQTATVPISKAEFVKKANAACAKIHQQAKSEFNDFLASLGEEPTTPAAIAAAQAELAEKLVIPPKQKEVEEFIALGVPSGDESQIKAIVAAFEEGISKAEEQPAKAAKDSSEAFGASEKLATEYGLEGC